MPVEDPFWESIRGSLDDDEFFQLDRDRLGFYLQEVVNGQPSETREAMAAGNDYEVSAFDADGFIWIRWRGEVILKLHKSRMFISNPVML